MYHRGDVPMLFRFAMKVKQQDVTSCLRIRASESGESVQVQVQVQGPVLGPPTRRETVEINPPLLLLSPLRIRESPGQRLQSAKVEIDLPRSQSEAELRLRSSQTVAWLSPGCVLLLLLLSSRFFLLALLHRIPVFFCSFNTALFAFLHF